MKIVVLCHYPVDLNYTKGGGTSMMEGNVEYLGKKKDLEIHVISLVGVKKDKTVKQKENVFIHYLSSPKIPSFLRLLTFDKWKVIKKIKEIDPDIVNAYMSFYGYYGFKSGYPTLTTVLGVIDKEYSRETRVELADLIRRPMLLYMERYVLKKSSDLIAITPYVKDEIEPYTEAEIEIVTPGVRDRTFEIKNNEVNKRLFVIGGVEPRKGYENLLNAMPIIREKHPDVTLHIAGRIRKADYFKSLKKIMKQHSLEDIVNFVGGVSEEEIEKEWSECSIFVLPSKEESFGIVLAEAGATGKPVVAFNIGGIPTIIQNGKTGFLFEYGDVDGMANSIIKLIEDPSLRKKIGQAGRKYVERFRYNVLADQIYNVLVKFMAKQVD